MKYALLTIGAIVLVIVIFKLLVNRVTILEYEKGLKYVRGAYKSTLGPGQYWYIPFRTIIQKIDVRQRFDSITGQEILSSDGVTLKVSIAANYEIADPSVAINKVQDFQGALYLELQFALRGIIGAVDIDSVLADRDGISNKLLQAAEPKATLLGLKLCSVDVKDIMFPGKLKELFSQVVNSRKEGLAALERSRGETAALRNLANAAKLIEGNPSLLQLRFLQALHESSGNTIVLGMPQHITPIPIGGRRTNRESGGAQETTQSDET